MKDLIKFIKKITEKDSRFGNQEVFSFNKIRKELDSNLISYKIQNFKNNYPQEIKCWLKADGKKIECRNTGFVGGEIKKSSLLIGLDLESEEGGENMIGNINYNIKSDSISLISFFDCPSVAISRKDVKKVKSAKIIKGETIVKKATFDSKNILVGNLKDPQNIIFTHYDSVEKGLIDNACGVAVAMFLLLKNKDLLKDNLFIFSGSEEISFDRPDYWGKGYRVFEEKYESLLLEAKKIIVVDGVGNGRNEIISDLNLVKQAIPLKNLNNFISKIFVLTGDFDDLMNYYHSSDDDFNKVKEGSLSQAIEMLIEEIS